MRFHLTSSIDVSSPASLILPCLPGDKPGEILKTYIQGFEPGDLSIGSDETLTIMHQKARIDCVCAKFDTYISMVKALQVYYSKNKKKVGAQCYLLVSHLEDNLCTGAIQGVALGNYNIGHYKTDDDNAPEDKDIHVVDAKGREKLLEKGINAADTQKEIFKLVNSPSNYKSPASLAEWATKSGKRHGFNVTVFDEKALADKGFDALLAVNRGSEEPARFIICDYNPPGATETVVLVGKGVTFDTGGVSLKPGHNMHLMKSDMGGAAAVLGAVELCAKQKVSVRVISCVPTTDNSIGTRAIKPGDVIGSLSGKTIEVINTDAEGRLILADGLHYAINEFSPDIVIDLATLTGSIVRTFGHFCAGLFSDDERLAAQLIEAGDTCGERLWRMPLWSDFAEDMRSDVADIKNLSDKPVAGAITAAKFLQFFTSEHKHWAHIDIAGTAFKTNGIARNHAATGFGVMLLYTFLEHLS